MNPIIPYASQADTPIDVWCEQNIILPSFTAKPGRLTLTAAQRGILQTYQLRECRELTAMMSSQIGKSLLVLCIMGFHLGNNPKQIMFVEPNQDLMIRFNKEKLYPLLEASPSLNAMVKKTRAGTFAPKIIEYSGGQILVATAGARNSLKSASTELVLADEVDGYKGATIDSSSPITMLRQRGATFEDDAKLVLVSTPTDAGASPIYKSYREGTASVFRVPCFHCGLHQQLLWENVKDSKLFCMHCGAHITENQRREILEEGHWVATNPDPIPGRFSFHLSQLYSPFKSIAGTASDWNPDDIRGSTTQILGWPYDNLLQKELEFSKLQEFETEEDLERIEAVTSGVDIQGNRIEANIVQWNGFYEKMHVKYHQVFYGKTDEREVWQELEKFFRIHKPDMIFIDRGYRPSIVENFCVTVLSKWWRRKKIRIVKGLSRDSFNDYPIPTLKDAKNAFKVRVSRKFDLPIATDNVKVRLHSLLESEGITVDPTRTPQDFWEQFTAEELRRIVRGVQEISKWVKIPNRRNEVLDCLVYAYCARELLGIRFNRFQSYSTLMELNKGANDDYN